MKTRWKVAIIAGVLVAAIAAAVVYLMVNLDSIVKAAIEKYGSQATKTAVRVSSVAIRLTEGTGQINGLSVANPQGFSSPHVFRLGKIRIKIDARAITSSPIVIDEIRIAAPQVVYEMNKEFASNILILKKNIQQSTATPKKEPLEKKTPSKELKIRIKKLVLDNGRIEAHVAALGDKPQTLTLKHFEMTDVGGPSGATPAQIAEQISTKLVDETGTAVARATLKTRANKEVNRALKRLLGK